MKYRKLSKLVVKYMEVWYNKVEHPLFYQSKVLMSEKKGISNTIFKF